MSSGKAQKNEEMMKVKKKLTRAQKRAKQKAKAERQKKYMWVFRNGKQVRIKRPPMIDGMDIDEFIQKNADPIWLHQNEMWEYIQTDDDEPYSLIQNCCDSGSGKDGLKR